MHASFFVEFLSSKMKEFSNICNDKLERGGIV
jgi:hypothetical protein